MTTAFLLRFQEQFINAAIGPVSPDRELPPFIQGVQVVTAPPHHSFPAEPHRADCVSALPAGTKTVTEIRQEAADSDPVTRSFDAIPKEI